MNNFGKYLKNYLNEKNRKLEYAAKEIGVSFGSLGHYINGRRSPSYKFLQKFFVAFNISEEEQKKILLYVEQDKIPKEILNIKYNSNINIDNSNFIETISVPIYESVSAGIGLIPDSEPVDYIQIPETSKNCVAIKISGDSMHPTMSDGDLIILKKDNEVLPGEIGIFIDKSSGESVVKRLKKKNGIYILESDNFEYPDLEIKSSDIVCCGKVINVIKKDLKKQKDSLTDRLNKLDSNKRALIEGLLEQLEK